MGMCGFVALMHIVGWSVVVLAIGTTQIVAHGRGVFGATAGLTAYLLGIRHAFDADHIAAVDNVTRRLVRTGSRPWSVGFWFAVGHSSVVFALTLVIAFGIRSVVNSIIEPTSQLHRMSELLGTAVSSGFLFAFAALNTPLLLDTWKTCRHLAANTAAGPQLRIRRGSLTNRILNRVTITAPRQMYLVGVFFGLGFDTATEVALLVMASAGAASGMQWYAVLSIPALFCAGMCLFDTLDGSLMTLIYRWAVNKPDRAAYYNLIVTTLSVAVALVVSLMQILMLLSERLGWHGYPATKVRAINMNTVGVLVVATFIATWIFSVIIRRVVRLRRLAAKTPALGS